MAGMKMMQRIVVCGALITGAALGGSGVAAADTSSATSPAAASAASCSSSIPRAVQTAATIYGVGSGGCSGYSSSLTVEVRESRGAGYAVVARAGCIAAANRSCTAITTRVTKRPGARYTVYQIGASPRF